ncbi:uncharacterized protein LOC143759144 [Siphateles boraxobius]|uniref:uncharacterized protein LOC143759144 n=1 Tax=Siphateles boraxobius TaxID=180520 RepID=UPI0040631602
MKYLVDKHREELCNKHVKGQSAWIRDFLAEYAESFPQLSSVLEANIHQCAYEQKGLENHTFQEMWDLYNQHSVQKARQEDLSLSERDLVRKAFSSVSRWLDTPVTNITSVQLKRFRKFVYDKNNQKSSSSINDPSWLDGTHLLEVIKSESTPSSKTSSSTASSTATHSIIYTILKDIPIYSIIYTILKDTSSSTASSTPSS